MCLCLVCIHTDAHVGLCMSWYTCGDKRTASGSHFFSSLFIWNPGFTWQTSLPAMPSCWSLYCVFWDRVTHWAWRSTVQLGCQAWLSTWGLWVGTEVSMLGWQVLYCLNHIPSPHPHPPKNFWASRNNTFRMTDLILGRMEKFSV